MSIKPPADDVPRQLVVHPALWPDLVEWLDQQGLDVGRLPVDGESPVPTYLTMPCNELVA